MAAAMDLDSSSWVLDRARERGYQVRRVRQEGIEGGPDDWVVVIHTPDGRTLYPTGIDDTEGEALTRAALRIAADMERGSEPA